MATGKSNKWDGNAHEALAVCLSRLHGTVTPEQQEALVKDMQNCGFDFTWEGIRQHLQKLKKKEGDKKNEKNEDEQVTPKKAKAAAGRAKKTGGTPGTPSQKKRNRANVDLDEDEDEIKVKKLKFEPQAPNLGQYYEDEPYPPSDGEVV